VATDDGALLGTCGVFPLGGGDWELRKMYLDAAARGRGVGRRLVLDTTEQMTRAIAFYEANGFVRDDAQVRGSRCSRGYARTL
jgi:putative acetyltransferase